MSKEVNGSRAGTPTVLLSDFKNMFFPIIPQCLLKPSDPSNFGDNSGISSVDVCQVTKKFFLE